MILTIVCAFVPRVFKRNLSHLRRFDVLSCYRQTICYTSNSSPKKFLNHSYQNNRLMSLGHETASLNTKDGVVKHLNSKEFHNLFSPGLKKVQALFDQNNYELRLCGGAVRDLLQGCKPKDLDFATVATPEQMISMFNNEGIRLINQTGWGHGTVTCRIEEENFEITTLRIDRITDGRHAIVEFTTDWKVDASRRDLTVNSMFLTLSGEIIDYFHGVEDLKNHVVRFVGDARVRITEDYLRILRYFRFFGRIANIDSNFDKSTIDIISQNLTGLNQVAGERIQTELVLIFKGHNVVRIVKMMQHCGLFEVIGLPCNADFDEFEKIYNSSKLLNAHYMTYVTALLTSENDLDVYHKRLRLSNLDLNIARFIIKHRSCNIAPSDRLAWYIDILVEYNKQFMNKASTNCFMEFLKYKGDMEALNFFKDYKIPTFPAKGNIVKEKTGAKGKDLGKIMQLLFVKWKESRYTLDQQQLLDIVNENTLSELTEKS